VGKDGGDLKGADNAAAGDLGGLVAGDINVVETDAAAAWFQELGQKIEASRLAGAIRADQGMDIPAADAQVHVIDCREALELLAQALGLQNVIVLIHPAAGLAPASVGLR